MMHMPHFAFEVVLTAIVVTLLVMIPTLLLYKLLVEPRFVRRERSGAVCCGCACLDLFLLNAEVLPTRESLALVENTSFTPGCSTSNTGRALAEMGTNVELLTLVGNDINGDTIMKIWQSQGIGVQFVRRTSDAPTSVATLPVYADGKRGIYFCRGCNLISDAKILFGDRWEHLYIPKSALLFHFGYPGLLPKMQGEALAEIFSKVKSTGAMISLDTVSLLDQEKHLKLVRPALPLTGVFHVNLEEAASLAGKIYALLDRAKLVSALTSAEDVITLDEIKQIAEDLLALGPGMVVVSLGCNGAFAATADEATLSERWGDLAKLLDVRAFANQRLYVPAFRATPGATINATGAGDAFIGGVLAGLNLSAARQAGLRRVICVGHAAALQRVELGRAALTATQALAAMDAGKFEVMVPPNPHLRAAAAAAASAQHAAAASSVGRSTEGPVRGSRTRSPRKSRPMAK